MQAFAGLNLYIGRARQVCYTIKASGSPGQACSHQRCHSADYFTMAAGTGGHCCRVLRHCLQLHASCLAEREDIPVTKQIADASIASNGSCSYRAVWWQPVCMCLAPHSCVSGSCGCCTSCYKCHGPGRRLALCTSFPKSGSPQQGQSVHLQEFESVHSLCSGTLAFVLKGYEVFG